ncbi:imidazolonepropionase [Desulfosporosinus sp. OT]|uniref:imidazolonepropionase n=1 Tax=Desulfosporosinus sp. OT TaxID=913865 RepID=UPI000223A18F|nr:imidazolonepropionase [Desulfosporosinus sp. OT]EGW38499.1 imidazolonepropionase [Desulfosporosinus sp. OT]
MPSADLFIHSANYLATVGGHSAKPAQGKEMANAGLIEDGALAIYDGKIVAVGKTSDVEESGWVGSATQCLNAQGKFVAPGFVDPHTHALYAGSREHELSLKIKGVPYLDILKQGGGILSTVRKTTQASDEEIKAQTMKRLSTMLSLGTTTAEVKSGYGLSLQEELRALRLIHELNAEQPIDLVATFMGAHAVPPEYSEESFTEWLVKDVLHKVAQENLAEYCDVFCEPGVFSVASSERILREARKQGFKLKIHADELESAGGAELAGQLQVVSAEHLLKASDEGISAMAKNNVIGVILPATSFNLANNTYARARDMIGLGMAIALATDCNPGSSPTESMPFVLTLACLYLRLTPEEALTAATINAAHAIGKADTVGSLEVGKQGDVLILDVPNIDYLPYHFGVNPVETVIKNGIIV